MPVQKEVLMDFQDNHTIFNSAEKPEVPNGYARTSRILGFIAVGSGLVSSILPFFAPLPLMFGMLSIVFGFVSKSQTGRFQNQAITGIVCSTVTLVFLLIAAIFLILFFNTAGGQQIVAEYLEQYNEMLDAYNEFYGY